MKVKREKRAQESAKIPKTTSKGKVAELTKVWEERARASEKRAKDRATKAEARANLLKFKAE